VTWTGRGSASSFAGWKPASSRTIAEVNGRQTERDYGKTSAAMRDVTIDENLAAELRARAEGHIFTAARGGRLQRSNFRTRWLKACAAAGVKDVRVHDLRHTSCSWAVNNGAPLPYVRDRMGHTDITTTSRYIHVVPGEQDPCVAALNRAMNAA
jgi:integrase